MRFLIVLSVFAYAAASPGAPVDVHRLTPALPTISAGDINGAVIEAHVEASDHFRAAVDATRQVSDKVSEIHGQAINNAEVQAWRAVDNVKTVEAKLDGAAASAAPIIAKNIVRGSLAAPAAYAAPAASYAAPAVSYAAPAVSYATPQGYYAAPEVSYAAPAVSFSAPIAPVPYGAPALTYSAPFAHVPYGAPIEYSAPAYTDYSAPVVGGYEYASPLSYAQAW